PYTQLRYRPDYQRGAPPVVNDEEATAVFATAARSAIGDEAVLNAPQSMGGEDFSWYLEEIPGSMPPLGVPLPGPDLDIHAASFDVDERCIAVGVRILVETAVQALDHYGASESGGGGRSRAGHPGRVGVGRWPDDHRRRFRVR